MHRRKSQRNTCDFRERQRVGITQGYLSKVENGQVISSEVAEKLASVLGITVEELLNGTEESRANRRKWEQFEKDVSEGKPEAEKRKVRDFASHMAEGNAPCPCRDGVLRRYG